MSEKSGLWSEKTHTLLASKLERIKSRNGVLQKMMKAVPEETRLSMLDYDLCRNALSSLGVEDIEITPEEGASQYHDGLAPSLPRLARKALEGHFHGDILARLQLSENTELNVEHIRSLHAMVTGRENPAIAGRFRTGMVQVGSSQRVFCGPSDVPKHMEAYVKRMNAYLPNTVETALFSHMGLVYIHPFADGNGRTARLLQNAVLAREGYPPIIIPENHRIQYRKHMEAAFFGSPEGLYSFLLDRLEVAIEEKIKLLEPRNRETADDLFGR